MRAKGVGPNEVPVGKDAIQQLSPSLLHYIGHLHIAVSGFIAATGLAVLFLVAYGVRRGELWAWVGAVAAPVLGLAVALPAHYPNHLDTLGHLGLIYLATVIFVAGRCWRCGGSSPNIEADDREGNRTMQAPATLLCAKCGEAADGWKCAICGSVARDHDPGHLHVGSDRYCTLRCAGCGQADVHCTCV